MTQIIVIIIIIISICVERTTFFVGALCSLGEARVRSYHTAVNYVSLGEGTVPGPVTHRILL